MATHAECCSMRDVMKSTLKQIILVLFWITIAALGVALLGKLSDMTFTFISSQTFILTRWFFWLVNGLNIVSVLLGIFMIICAIVCTAKELGNEILYFSIAGATGLALPVLEKGVLMILELYFPDNKLPENLCMLSDWLLIYSIILGYVCAVAAMLGVVFHESNRY